MNVFKRLIKIGQAETQSAIDKLEDPIKMIEQGLRDMREDQDRAMRALAEVKAMHIRRNKERQGFQDLAEDLQSKSILLLKKAQQGDLDATEAENLVKENLKRKAQTELDAKIATEDVAKLEKQVASLEQNVNTIKSNIKQWESELQTLKARVKVSNATQKINKQMTDMDSSSVVSMLERMKDKVAQDEALADAYSSLAKKAVSHGQKLHKVLEDLTIDDALNALKKELGIK
jgi:phage shock protein A